MQFDFTQAFKVIGTQIVKGLRMRIINQKGLDGASYPSPTPATLAIRKQKTGKGGKALKSSGSTKRMYVTGDTANEAFSYLHTKTGVSVFALGFNHRSGDVKYNEIIRDNSKGLPGLNTRIKETNKPIIFPSKPDEIWMLKEEMANAKKILSAEASKQFNTQMKTNIKIKLNVG